MRGTPSAVTLVAICLNVCIAAASAQSNDPTCANIKTAIAAAAAATARADAQEVQADATKDVTPVPTYDGETLVTTAMTCAGWIDQADTSANKNTVPIYLPAERGTSNYLSASFPGSAGASQAANEFFSLIAEIAVDKAQREGLALVHDQLTNLICSPKLSFPIPDENGSSYHLDQTCDLIRTTDLQSLVGQGKALRAALTDDLLGAAKTAVKGDDKIQPPLGNAAFAALDLVGRVASDPNGRITRNDVWLVADALLNGNWTKPADSSLNLRCALAAARVYVQAVEWSNAAANHPTIDLASVVQKVIATYSLKLTPEEFAAFEQNVNLAVTMATAMSGQNEDLQARLQAAIQLTFESLKDFEGNAKWPGWAETITLAALNADAPHLISALAQTGAEADTCQQPQAKEDTDCLERQKIAVLLTGISTYAITYENPPSDPQALAAFQQRQQEARKQALESVIDAATDRRGRAGHWVTSLGVGVGYAYSPAIGSLKDQIGKQQLHLPMGVAVQELPGRKGDSTKIGLGWHLMGTVLDLGNYVRSSNTSSTKIDWQSIVAPGFEGGAAIGKANTFFVLGGGITFSPHFANITSDSSNHSLGAAKWELFAQYYFPLWDFN